MTRPVGYGWHDHLCWVYDGRATWVEAAVAFLAEGAARGERLCYVADNHAHALVEDLARLPARDAMLACGQLTVIPISEAYGPADAFNPARQVAAFGQLASAAVAQGYRGLRLAADTSSLVTSEADLYTFTGYELLVDAMITRQPLLALCGYDQGATAPGAADALCFVHPLHHRPAAQTMAGVKVGTDNSEGLFADVSGGWRLRGTLDLATARSLGAALAALPQDGDLHLYLEELRFCDAAATRALVRAAMQRHPAGRLVLHHAPPLLLRVLRLGWPGDNPGLHVAPS